MKPNNKLLLLLLLIPFSVGTAIAQSRILPILSNNTDVRSKALGNTVLGTTNQMYLYSNPSTFILDKTDKKGAADFSVEYYPATEYGRNRQYTLGGAYKLGKRRAIFLGARHLSGLRIPFYNDEGAVSSSAENKDWTVDLGYAFSVLPNLIVYGTGTYYSTAVASKATGFSFGAGVGYHKEVQSSFLPGVLNLGVRLQDAGTPTQFDGTGPAYSLPTSVSAGGDYQWTLSQKHQFTYALSARYFVPKNAPLLTVGTGVEYLYDHLFAIRTGYNYSQNELSAWTFGLGGNYAGVHLDVTYNLSLRPETGMSTWLLALGYNF